MNRRQDDPRTETETCDFVFDPTDWADENLRPSPLDEMGHGTWSCPHDAKRDGRCFFHLPQDERKAVDEKDILKAFLDSVDSSSAKKNEFVGATFGDIKMYYELADPGGFPLSFYHCTIKGTFDLSDSVLTSPIYLKECSVTSLRGSGTDFQSTLEVSGTEFTSVDFSDARFRSRAQFDSVEFDREADFTGAEFHRLELRGDEENASRFSGAVDFQGCTFHRLFVNNVLVEGPIDFSGARFGTAEFEDNRFRTVDFRGTEFDGRTEMDDSYQEGPDLTRAKFHERLRLDPTPTDEPIEIGLQQATIDGGWLRVPDEGVYYNLYDATVGNVEFDIDDPGQLKKVLLLRTRFDGFRFVPIRGVLEECDWEIHHLDRVGEGLLNPGQLDCYDPHRPGGWEEAVLESEVSESLPDESLEHTYLEAKKGAQQVGDAEAASEFFFKEASFRHRRYQEVRTRSLTLAIKYLMHLVLRATSGYGERPLRVVGWSLAVIAVTAALYPLSIVGGLATDASQSTGPLSYAGVDGPLALLAVGWKSLYFSTITFTTLGFGNVVPADTGAELLAVAESLLGAFLIATFVWSLGQKTRQ